MKARIGLLSLIILLSACAQPPAPEAPSPLDCPKPGEAPVDGGYGGTGQKPPEHCRPPEV